MDHHHHRGLCLWPGLAGLWVRGQWSSLVLAVAFAIMLNLALACSFVWPDLLGPTFPLVAWPVLTITWCLSFWVSWKTSDSFAETGGFAADQHDTLFIQAQNEYLNRNWHVCYQMLARHLTDNPRDLESRLLLATTCRRLDRPDEARHQLATFRKIDGWQQWSNEVQRELHLIEDQFLDDDNETAPDSGATEPDIININNHQPDTTADSAETATDQTGAIAGRGIRLGQSIDGIAKINSPENEVTDREVVESENDEHRKRAA